jgi:hypothetical protein
MFSRRDCVVRAKMREEKYERKEKTANHKTIVITPERFTSQNSVVFILFNSISVTLEDLLCNTRLAYNSFDERKR